MREIKGIVCKAQLAEYPRHHLVFGPNTNLSVGQAFQDFVTNGLHPYATLAEALQGYHQIEARPRFTDPRLARLRMLMQETEEELEEFQRRRRFVVVMMHGGQPSELIGMHDPRGDQIGYIGTTFFSSGLTPIPDFNLACHIARQANRQGHGSGHLATWQLLPISPIPMAS